MPYLTYLSAASGDLATVLAQREKTAKASASEGTANTFSSMNSASLGYSGAAERKVSAVTSASYSVRRSVTSGPSSAQNAPRLPYGIPHSPD